MPVDSVHLNLDFCLESIYARLVETILSGKIQTWAELNRSIA